MSAYPLSFKHSFLLSAQYIYFIWMVNKFLNHLPASFADSSSIWKFSSQWKSWKKNLNCYAAVSSFLPFFLAVTSNSNASTFSRLNMGHTDNNFYHKIFEKTNKKIFSTTCATDYFGIWQEMALPEIDEELLFTTALILNNKMRILIIDIKMVNPLAPYFFTGSVWEKILWKIISVNKYSSCTGRNWREN